MYTRNKRGRSNKFNNIINSNKIFRIDSPRLTITCLNTVTLEVVSEQNRRSDNSSLVRHVIVNLMEATVLLGQ